jgi:hypothetical protein
MIHLSNTILLLVDRWRQTIFFHTNLLLIFPNQSKIVPFLQETTEFMLIFLKIANYLTMYFLELNIVIMLLSSKYINNTLHYFSSLELGENGNKMNEGVPWN